jgi:hypothetical protein
MPAMSPTPSRPSQTTPTPVKRLVTPIPRYERTSPDNLPVLRLTDRDRRILETVHTYDGILSFEQLRHLFFGSRTATTNRLMLLYQHGYLERLNRRQRAAYPYMLYWLGEKGAAYVAGLSGLSLSEFSYRHEPRWSQVEHDLAVNEVRMALTDACQQEAGFELLQWIPESEFHAQPDRVEWVDATGKRDTRTLIPDGYSLLSRGAREFRFLWEMDRRTEDNPRFVREKVLPGLAYLASSPYKARFGFNTGQWLIITTGNRRLRNMKRQTEWAAKAAANRFYFTTLDQITSNTILTAPIWQRGGESKPIPLFKVEDPLFVASARRPRSSAS